MGDLSVAQERLAAARQTDRALKAIGGMLEEHGAEHSYRADVIKALAKRPFGRKLDTRGWRAVWAIITKGRHLSPRAREVVDAAGMIAFHAGESGSDPRHVRWTTMKALEAWQRTLACRIAELQLDADAPFEREREPSKHQQTAHLLAEQARLRAELASCNQRLASSDSAARPPKAIPSTFDRERRVEAIKRELGSMQWTFYDRRSELRDQLHALAPERRSGPLDDACARAENLLRERVQAIDLWSDELERNEGARVGTFKALQENWDTIPPDDRRWWATWEILDEHHPEADTKARRDGIAACVAAIDEIGGLASTSNDPNPEALVRLDEAIATLTAVAGRIRVAQELEGTGPAYEDALNA
jgi:hypothetical protein